MTARSAAVITVGRCGQRSCPKGAGACRSRAMADLSKERKTLTRRAAQSAACGSVHPGSYARGGGGSGGRGRRPRSSTAVFPACVEASGETSAEVDPGMKPGNPTRAESTGGGRRVDRLHRAGPVLTRWLVVVHRTHRVCPMSTRAPGSALLPGACGQGRRHECSRAKLAHEPDGGQRGERAPQSCHQNDHVSARMLRVSNAARPRAAPVCPYRRYLLKWAIVRSHASLAAAAS